LLSTGWFQEGNRA